MMKLKHILKFGFGILILGMLFYKIGFNEIIETLKTVNFFWLIFGIPVFIVTFIIGTCKLILLFKRQGYNLSFSKVFRYSFLGWAVGTITPGKIGEFSLVYFLQKEGIEIGKGAAITLLDKLITVSTYAMISVAGIFCFFTLNETIKMGVVLALFLGGVCFGIISKKSRDFVKRFILRKYAEKFRGFSKTLFDFLKNEKIILLLTVGISFCKHTVNSFLPFLYFLALGVHVSYFHIFLITGIIIGVSIVPITISGLGIKETLAVFLYGYIAGVASPVIASTCVLALIFKYGTAGIGSMLLWQKK